MLKAGDMKYTFIDPDDEWGLDIAQEPVLVIILQDQKDCKQPYSTVLCLSSTCVLQKLSIQEIHETKESAYFWYERYYGKMSLRTFRGC